MIEQSTNISKLLLKLTKDFSTYYIEQSFISSKETLNSLTIYSRFQRYNGSINKTLIKQHINKEINLAISIKNSDIHLFKYFGKDAIAFGALLFKIASKYNIKDILISEYGVDRLIIFFISKNKDISNQISNDLNEYLIKEWRVLPNNNLPELGNLFILPREIIKAPWNFR